MYFLMSSVIVNYKCSIGGFPVGVNWVLGGFCIHICVWWGCWGLQFLSCWFGVMLSKVILSVSLWFGGFRLLID